MTVTIRKATPELVQLLLKVADKTEGKLQAAIVEALVAQGDALDINVIAAALDAGNLQKVLELLDLPAVLAPLEAMTPALQDAIYAAGAVTVGSMNLAGAGFVFNRLNPRLITWLQTYSLRLIREINDSTKEAIRVSLVQGMQAGKNPKATARQIKEVVGLTRRQAAAVQNYRAELESWHLKRSAKGYNLGAKIDRVNGTQVLRLDENGLPMDGITRRRLRDFRYEGALKQHLGSGKPIPPEKIDKMVEAYHRKYLAYRSRTIARTESIRTTNIGVQEAWAQAIERGLVNEDLVRKQWLVAKDERTCSICNPIPRMNEKKGVPLSSAFKTPNGPISLPPVHPNCRCTIFVRQWEPWQMVADQ